MEVMKAQTMLAIRAKVTNTPDGHQVTVSTNDALRPLDIPPKDSGRGSSANGAELLFLALATCYCNDIFREAARRGIHVSSVDVQVDGSFAPEPGSTASDVRYLATVTADASEADILDLMAHTDAVAEIQNTLRAGVPVALAELRAISSLDHD
jgi:organic hydroperoxide reductase OsmC/OhrA